MKALSLRTILLASAALTVCAAQACAAGWADDGEITCEAPQWQSNGLVTHAEAKEQRLANAADNYISPGQNGSVRIHGWNNGDVRVRACIHAAAESEAEARRLASEIKIVEGPGRITPSGPSRHDDRQWSVSYEIWLPETDSIDVAAHNGSIRADGINGRVKFHTENGSVRLSKIGGNVDGSSTNGSLTLDVTNSGWKGDEMRLRTTNGSLHLNLPANFSAQVKASTVNGRVHTDFPATVHGNIGRMNDLSFQIGSGGPLIEAHTVNGSVHIGRGA